MPSADDPVLEVDDILASFRGRVGAVLAEHADLADRTVQRLLPPRWTVEWYLPWWLGAALGVRPDDARELVLSNVLGLVAIRLEDDLRDGDLESRDIEGARVLAPVLVQEALNVYRAPLADDREFWAVVDGTLSTWRAGSDSGDPAGRAAPLRIGAFGVCRLAGRSDVWPRLDRCLAEASAALVHYDQFCDWDADLAAGRWNTFVASVAPVAQQVGDLGRSRATVFSGMLTRNVVGEHFALIGGHARAATELAAELGLAPFATYLSSWSQRVQTQGDEVVDHYRAARDSVTRLMFGNAGGGVFG